MNKGTVFITILLIVLIIASLIISGSIIVRSLAKPIQPTIPITPTLNQNQTCQQNGNTYGPGESVPSSDTCNTCSCDNGQIACTAMACTTTFSCPDNGWVDCMPGPDIKPECSTEAMMWYKNNCPNFQGAAL